MTPTICPLCGEDLAGQSLILHNEIDEWLFQLVIQKHPDWKQSDGACKRCWEEVARLKQEADQL